MTERYSTCWEDDDYPYLQSVEDSRAAGAAPFCDTADREVLAQVLNDYDLETEDFFRWKTEYSAGELSALISGKLGTQIGRLLAILPVERGASGRLSLVGIVGTEHSIRVGKELEIRKILSDTHLKSSAFVVSYYDASGRQVPSADVEEAAEHFLRTGELPSAVFDKVVLEGRGWGHGVGLCQIGAAVMASEGYSYTDILSHYYKGAEVKVNG